MNLPKFHRVLSYFRHTDTSPPTVDGVGDGTDGDGGSTDPRSKACRAPLLSPLVLST